MKRPEEKDFNMPFEMANYKKATEDYIDYLESKVKKSTETDQRWKPEKGEGYWYVSIEPVYRIWNNSKKDDRNYNSGNYFKGQGESKTQRDKINQEIEYFVEKLQTLF
jgi:hypothetical protein